MSGSLRDFLVELASSSELMAQFVADPVGVLDRSGLSADAKHAILARDSDRLRQALGASPADHLTQVSAVRKRSAARKRTAAQKRKAATKRAGAKKRPPAKKGRPGTKKR